MTTHFSVPVLFNLVCDGLFQPAVVNALHFVQGCWRGKAKAVCFRESLSPRAEDLQIYPRSPFADITCLVLLSCVMKSGLSVKILHSNTLHLLFSVCTQKLAERCLG